MDYGYVAYIDESGDPGLNKVKPRFLNGSSEWIVVAAALVPKEMEAEVKNWVSEMMVAMRSHQLFDLHFHRLNAYKKSLLCTMVAQKHVRLFAVISNKQNMQGYNNPLAAQIPSDNWFYCWLTRVLLERLTEYVLVHSTVKYGSPKMLKLEYSERGGLSYGQMNAYYDWIRLKSADGRLPLYLPWGRVQFDVLHRDLMNVYSHKTRDGMKLADITASAFFKAVDIYDTRECDPTFARLLRPVMAKAPDTKQIGGFGVKLLPNWKTLKAYNVQERQKAIFREYGYPGNYWWQVEGVDPGFA